MSRELGVSSQPQNNPLLFKEISTSGEGKEASDGKVGVKELVRAYEKLGMSQRQAEKQAQTDIAIYDADGSGSLGITEWNAMRADKALASSPQTESTSAAS